MNDDGIRWAMGFTFMTESIGSIRAAIDGISFPPSATMRLHVAVGITTEGSSGFPNNEEAAELGEIEDDLTNGLVDPLFVAAVTADGCRDFHLYAHPDSQLDQWIRRLSESHVHHVLKFARADDPEHSFYEFLRNEAESADADRRTVDELSANGADLNKKHELRHFLYFTTEEGALTAAADTAGNHLTPEISRAEDGQWLLLLSGPGYAGHHAVASDRRYLDAVASKNGGDYDGWEAAVEPYED